MVEPIGSIVQAVLPGQGLRVNMFSGLNFEPAQLPTEAEALRTGSENLLLAKFPPTICLTRTLTRAMLRRFRASLVSKAGLG
ncbi:MAG: hypothetical protein CM1200mP9_05320 [Gammaproteobacteria bacterium]|nr:MAG: hypothetical protein CM1200mP9_05320 [Gammaproteobacteria bacterium]